MGSKVIFKIIILYRYNIPSAIDVEVGKLVLFLKKAEEDELKRVLMAKIGDLGDNFKQEYIVQPLERPIEIFEETGHSMPCPGFQIEFDCPKNESFRATAGAFVRTTDETLYILSSCHGKRVQHCYFIDSEGSRRYECIYKEGVYSQQPLLDACLLEVIDQDLKKTYESCLQIDTGKVAFCRPDSGLLNKISGNPKERVGVSKYEVRHEAGSLKAFIKNGFLKYRRFQYPQEGITQGLVFAPSKESGEFTEAGESGSVIFHKTPRHGQNSTLKKNGIVVHEALAMHCRRVENLPSGNCSLAFRLDHIIEYFESKLGMDIKFLPPL